MGKAVVVVLASLLLLPVAQQSETWRGAIDLSSVGQGELEFFVTFIRAADGVVVATLSIPAQGATDLPVVDVVYTASRLEFTLATQPAGEFRADREGDTARGTLKQGAELPISLRRLEAEEVAAPERPQHPDPPFPYAQREVTYTNPADGTELAGTLTLPETGGPHPAALLITGSGSQDRDETIFGHKPFWVIADHLTRNGVAVLRVDDRGVGGSRGPTEEVTTFDFAGDVRAGVDFLAHQADIDGARIGLIGHSEGGLIAPIVAAEDARVAFVVLLAGPGISGRELMPLQVAAIQRALGRSQENIERQLQAMSRMYELVVNRGPEEELRLAVDALVDTQLESVPAPQRAALREQAVTTAMSQVQSEWWRAFLATDPREFLAAVNCPVLALNGTLDLQVPAEANLPVIEATLREAGNDDVTVQALEGLNHLFQTATTGSFAEYGQITETFAPRALEIMTVWIKAHTGLD